MLMMGFCEILLQTNCNQLVAGMLLEQNLEQNIQKWLKCVECHIRFIVHSVLSQLAIIQGSMANAD